MMQLKKIKNIPHKLRREIYRVPAFNALKEQAYQKMLDAHSPFLPLLDSQSEKILAGLRCEGTCIIPLERLKLASTERMMAAAYQLADELIRPVGTNSFDPGEVRADIKELRESPEILLWALEPKLLDIIENYIGLPILYQGFGVRRSVADGQYSGVRRWHIDWEDRRIIKVIIYLNDVVAGGGPYEYIERSITTKAIETLDYYNLGYLSDAEMSRAVPPQDWSACLAKRNSVIITDTSNVFHRAQPPTLKERFSITFCYTSASPLVIWQGRKISREQWELVNSQLNDRQRNCLTKRKFG